MSAKKSISNSFTVNTVEDGESAPYYFQEWFAWSNDASTSSVTTAPAIAGSWATSIPAQGSYAYLWRKSIRYVWNENTRQYRAETAQYFRMSGTNGTSIRTRGQVANASSRGTGTATIITDSGTQTITLSDGDAVTQLDNGHLYQWVTEGGGKWLDLGQFKGESGKTYYTHIAWATNVSYNSSGVVTSVDGFIIDKSPNDTTHLWMGVLVNEDSSTDSSDSLDYTWSYTKGIDGFSVQAQYAPNNNPSSSQIHNTWQNGDLYMRTKQSNETTWSSWNKIVGESGGETNYQFAISANKVSQDGTSATAPTDISSSDWQDAPLIVTTAKPYLWSKVQKKDGGGNNVGNPSYMRLTGEESIEYSVEGALNTIKVGAGQTTTMVNCTYTFYTKPAVSSTRSTVSCYYAVYLRSGNTFSLLTMSTGYNNHGSGTSVSVNSNVPYKSGSVVYNAVVIYIFPSSYYSTSPESQNYMAKKEIPIVKDGDSVSYDEEHSSIGYAYSSMGTPESGRDYPSDITSWSPTPPAVQKGKYLWTKDVTAYNNAGTIVYTTTYGVQYQPNDGESVEIDSSRTFIKYCRQTKSQYTGQHPADINFSTTYPTNLGQGDYLWILNQVAYVGVANPLKSYSVTMLGTDGSKGDPGADGYTTHFAYATSADGSQNFSTTNFNGATYIGTYRDQLPNDSTNYRDYVWTPWKGQKGDQGEQGDKGDKGDDALTLALDTYAIAFPTDSAYNVESQKTYTVGARMYLGNSTQITITSLTARLDVEDGDVDVTQTSPTNGVVITLGESTFQYNIGVNVTAVCAKGTRTAKIILTAAPKGVKGDKGNDGIDGARGKVGRFFYFGGTFNPQDNDPTHVFVVNDAQAPYFEHTETVTTQSGTTTIKRYHVFNYDTNGTYTMAQMWAIRNSWNYKPWESMTNDFKYLITEAIFGAYAHFGANIINKDFRLSQYGYMRGFYDSKVAVDDDSQYQYFDDSDPFGEKDMFSKDANMRANMSFSNYIVPDSSHYVIIGNNVEFAPSSSPESYQIENTFTSSCYSYRFKTNDEWDSWYTFSSRRYYFALSESGVSAPTSGWSYSRLAQNLVPTASKPYLWARLGTSGTPFLASSPQKNFTIEQGKYYAITFETKRTDAGTFELRVGTKNTYIPILSSSLKKTVSGNRYVYYGIFFNSYTSNLTSANLWTKISDIEFYLVAVYEAQFVPMLCEDLKTGKLVVNNVVARGELHADSLYYSMYNEKSNNGTIPVEDKSIVSIGTTGVGSVVKLPSPSASKGRKVEVYNYAESWKATWDGATSTSTFTCPYGAGIDYRTIDQIHAKYVLFYCDGSKWWVLRAEN